MFLIKESLGILQDILKNHWANAQKSVSQFHGPTQNGEDSTFEGNNELLAHLEILTIAFLILCHCSLSVTQKWVMFTYKGQNEKQSDFPNP